MTRLQPFSFWSMPSKEEWKVFLEHYEAMSDYTKINKFIIPEIERCVGWLKEQTNDKDKGDKTHSMQTDEPQK